MDDKQALAITSLENYMNALPFARMYFTQVGGYTRIFCTLTDGRYMIEDVTELCAMATGKRTRKKDQHMCVYVSGSVGMEDFGRQVSMSVFGDPTHIRFDRL